MLRLRFGSSAILLSALALGLAACSYESDGAYRQSPAVTSSGASTVVQSPQVVGTAPPVTIAALTADSVSFIFQAGYFGAGAMQAGQLAPQRAASPQLLALASTMVGDFSLENAALTSVGNAKGVIPPAVPDAGRQAAIAVLQGLQGPIFDREYVEQQIADHRAAVALFGAQAERGQDPDIRSLAAQYLPVLQSHLAQLTALAGQAVISSR
jgi:putative membrane protein